MYIIQAYQMYGGIMKIYKGQAIKIAGNKSKLAKMLGITRQAIQQWPDRKPIPQKYADYLIENGCGS